MGFFGGNENIKIVNSGVKTQLIKTLNCVLITKSVAFYTFFAFVFCTKNPIQQKYISRWYCITEFSNLD